MGRGTIFAGVGKLFVVNLAYIDAFRRVFLSLGSGSLSLALSYYLRSLAAGSGVEEESLRLHT